MSTLTPGRIRHTVTFTLVHEPGSPEEADFLAAQQALVSIPGVEAYELEAPAVLSLGHAREADDVTDGRIDLWTAADLVDDLRENDKRFGQPGSPTRVLAVRDVTPERAGRIAVHVDETVPPRGRSRGTSPNARARRTTAGHSSRPSTAGRRARRSS